jgi:hypothetical protein
LSWLICLAVFIAGMARASAQTIAEIETLEEKLSRSHLLDTKLFGLPEGNAEELFLQRLKAIQIKEIGEGLGKKLPRKELDAFSQNQDLVAKYLKDFKFSQLPAELRDKFAGRDAEDLEKFIRSMDPQQFLKYAREAQGLPNPTKPSNQQSETATTTPSPPTTPEPSTNPRPSESGSQAQDAPPSATNGEDQPKNSVLSRWLLQAANRFQNLDPAVRNSPALRKLMRDLGNSIDQADERWKVLDKGADAFAERLERLGQALPLDRLWPEKGISWPRSLSAESLPNLHLPELGPRLGGRPSASAQKLGIPELSNFSGWSIVWILAFLAAVGVVLWKVVGRSQINSLGERPDAWKLGPWPVDPTTIQTREELIRAFEYLSVLRLGPEARCWHHWAIGSGLSQSSGPAIPLNLRGNGSPEQRRAALELASLYERARYAPPAEPLPEATLALARRDLCLLAGVALS